MKILMTVFMTLMTTIVLTSAASASSIALVEDQTYIIPGFTYISEYRFADIESDGKPEILVRYKTHLALYAPEPDSILWEYELDPAGSYRVLAADITRDSVLDIVVGLYTQDMEYSDSTVIIDIFDGSTNWTEKTRYYHPTVKYSPYWGGSYFSYYAYGGFPIFNCYDINGDGYNEFLFSYGNTVIETNGLEYLETVNGLTSLYYQYPDSLLWKYGMLCENARPVNPGYSNLLTANSRYYRSHTGHGDDYYELRLNLRLFSESGTSLLLYHPLETIEYEKNPAYDYGFESSVTVHASGFIDSNNDVSDLLVIYSWKGFNEIAGTFTSYIDKRLYNLLPPDSLELSWVTDYGYLNKHTYVPNFPGVFFAFNNDSLKMFSGDNGEFLDGAPATPQPLSQWLIMPDNSVRLVHTNYDTIFTQRVDKVTDIDDDPAAPLPTHFSLGQPYPNPFNASQTIPVTTIPGKMLTVDVYNLLGQKIDRLYSGVAYTAQMNLTWKADRVASGIYFIRATSDDATVVKKSILLK